MTKYVLYRRLSVEDKSRNQHGFDSQMLDIRDYLKDVGEYEIVGDFKEFVSGGADIKPELEKALQLCRETGATLVVAKLDRLSRRVSQIARYMEGDVTFKVSTMPSANNLQLHIFAALAEEERATIRRRVQRGLEAAKAKGKKIGGENPQWKQSYNKNKSLGLHNDSSLLKKNPNTEALAAKIENIAKRENYRLTSKELADNLNSYGITTATGKSWSDRTLRVFAQRNSVKLFENQRSV